jgi:hypothetical protein
MTWTVVPAADPITAIRRRLAELAHLVAQAKRAKTRQPTAPRYHAHREAFIEDAAMAREMLRL